MKKKELGKDERIKREIKRVSNIYSEISEKERAAIEGLIRRAAFMRVTLEDMEADLAAAESAADWLDRLERRVLARAAGPYDNYTAVAVLFRGVESK